MKLESLGSEVAAGPIARECAQLLRDSGIIVGGSDPWDVRIYDPEVYHHAWHRNVVALGEAYEDGYWDCDRIDELIFRLIKSNVDEDPSWASSLLSHAHQVLSPPVGRTHPHRGAEVHYDIGNDLFERMLDRNMVYSCGYWRNAKNLDEAQEAKLDLICRKLGLSAGMRVLDIGGGWGGFARYAARNYGVAVTNVTISREQYELSSRLSQGLPIENLLQDYRDINGIYDRVVSVGMLEHVGAAHLREFMDVVRARLRPDGLALVHVIGCQGEAGSTNAWLDKFIFPGGYIPKADDLVRGIGDLFVIEDWHNFGADYDRTLMAWWDNFEASWETLGERFGERFYRRWKLYLQGCAGAFRARRLQVYQLVLSPEGVPGGYDSIR